ncbi:MAG: hypothetical protein JST92_05520, partial [Deltaproteobacteria bacterium]|nr:hypothetical protein [Deltaproteobacteria bacterium]
MTRSRFTLLTIFGLALCAGSAACIVGGPGFGAVPDEPQSAQPAGALAAGPSSSEDADDEDEGEDGDDDDDDEAVPPPASALPPAKDLDQASAEQQLDGYGRWVDTPEYGRVWVPANVGEDWQPYTDGTWAYTSYGWSFVAGVPWGGVTFHYGRWGYSDVWGWYWIPGFVWAPAWVSWRWAPGYICWSPLGPHGYRYGRHWRGWVTVGAHGFGPHMNIRSSRVSGARGIVRGSSPIHSIGSRHDARPQGGHFYGPSRGNGGRTSGWGGAGGRGGGGRGTGGHSGSGHSGGGGGGHGGG